jgi:hypothetical protein
MGHVLQTLCLAPAPLLALVVLALAAPQAWAEQPGMVKIADGPAFSIIRGDKLFEAAKGVKLLAGDFIETQPGSFVVADLSAGSVVALGPSTRLYLSGGDGATFVVLRGWLKLDAHPAGEGALRRATAMQLGAATREGVFVLHASDHRDEVFQESGVMTLLVRDDAVTRSNRESKITQYFAREDRNLTVAPRPSAPFVAEMPVQFRDPLPQGLVGGVDAKLTEPKLIRDVSYPDVADWLTIPLEWRTGMVRRFRGRLKDRVFFSAMDAHLSSHPEWTVILHPPPPPPPQDEIDARPDGRKSTAPASRRTENERGPVTP